MRLLELHVNAIKIELITYSVTVKKAVALGT